MSKKSLCYSCVECGATYSKWVGRCSACNSWNTVIEEVRGGDFDGLRNMSSAMKSRSSGGSAGLGVDISKLQTLSGEIKDTDRIRLKNSELNRVFGGGLVPGSIVLIAGEPGVGKSTLMLNLSKEMVDAGYDVLYASGEESANQIRMRAARTGALSDKIKLASKMDLATLGGIINSFDNNSVVIIDSIQTVYSEDIPSTPGSVTQVKACAHELTLLAKRKNICLFIVGHINKDGQIAGPKVLEHIVDVVLYFEIGLSDAYRMIRNAKNRFGSVQEVGIFAMSGGGLEPVTNPSEMFLSKVKQNNIGSVAFAGIEGTRALFTQVESLVIPSYMTSPRRAVVGWDQNRLAMVVAIMSSKLYSKMYDKEVYLNITGGLKIIEPAADLAVLVSLLSSYLSVELPYSLVCFGEVSLSGEVKQVYFAENRVREAVRLGFKTILCPSLSKDLAKFVRGSGVELVEVGDVSYIRKSGLFADARHPVKKEGGGSSGGGFPKNNISNRGGTARIGNAGNNTVNLSELEVEVDDVDKSGL